MEHQLEVRGLAKLNQILRIEEELGSNAIYAGSNFRKAVEL